MRRWPTPPTGQALVESAAVLLGFISLTLAVSLTYRVSESAVVTNSEARFDLDRCRLDPSGCESWLEALDLGSGSGALDRAVVSYRSASGQQQTAAHLQVVSTVDRPPAEISGSSLSSALQRSLLGLADSLADELFLLPDGRQLIRIQAQQSSELSGVSLQHNAGFALVADDWASATVATAQQRIQSGAEPSEAIRLAAEIAYLPVTEAAMPLAEFLQIEDGSEALADSFHRRNWMQSFPGLSTPIQ